MKTVLRVGMLLCLLLACVKEEAGQLKGVDHEGKEKTCVPAEENIVCTEIFTPADEFANECRSAGKKAVQCGCHDWICVE